MRPWSARPRRSDAPAAMDDEVLVGIAIDIDFAGDRCPVHHHGERGVPLVVDLMSPRLDHEGDLGLWLSAAKIRGAALDRVPALIEGAPADSTKALWVHRTGVLACDYEQRLCLLAGDALASHAVEPGGGDDPSSLSSAAAVELRDQAAQRLRPVRKDKFVELGSVIPKRRGPPLVNGTIMRRCCGGLRPFERVRVARQRWAESDFNPGAMRELRRRHLDDRGRAIGLRAQHDAPVAGDDDERTLRRQNRASDNAQAVAECATLREPQQLRRAHRASDAE